MQGEAAISSENIKEALKEYLKTGRKKVSGTGNHKLKLSDDEILGQTDSSLVWLGELILFIFYNNINKDKRTRYFGLKPFLPGMLLEIR